MVRADIEQNHALGRYEHKIGSQCARNVPESRRLPDDAPIGGQDRTYLASKGREVMYVLPLFVFIHMQIYYKTFVGTRVEERSAITLFS